MRRLHMVFFFLAQNRGFVQLLSTPLKITQVIKSASKYSVSSRTDK